MDERIDSVKFIPWGQNRQHVAKTASLNRHTLGPERLCRLEAGETTPSYVDQELRWILYGMNPNAFKGRETFIRNMRQFDRLFPSQASMKRQFAPSEVK
jgi:hypothetical protein